MHAVPALALDSIQSIATAQWQRAAVVLGALYLLKKAATFVLASCDMNLLSKKDPPRGYFNGKVVWIVGATQGLGRALAVTWASQGARLVLSSRNREALERLKGELLGGSEREYSMRDEDVTVVPFDITDDFEKVQQAADTAFSSMNGVDYVVYNAGASQHARVEETCHHVAVKLVQLNLIGQMAVSRAILPHLLRQGHGHHVVISSMAAQVPSPGQAVYSAAKSALKSYFLSMETELHDRGIEVSVICPGPVDAGDNGGNRMVYGKDGMMEQKNKSKSRARVSLDMFARMVLRAVYNKINVCMISNHPVLLMGYVMQYAPRIAMKVLRKAGPGRVKQLETGSGTGYDVRAMMK
jgi:dehydrogenase/reductase SDR family protein 7